MKYGYKSLRSHMLSFFSKYLYKFGNEIITAKSL